MKSSETITVFRPPVFAELLHAAEDSLQSHWWSYGPACATLEQTFVGERQGRSLAVSSCTAGLHLTGLWLARQGGGEVIVPAMTFVSTGMAFAAAGLRVRIADVDSDTLLINLDSVKSRLTSATRSLVVVHLYGQEVDLRPWRRFCDEHGLWLIEDCAHRVGTPGGPTLADFSCYSFNTVKEAPAGEGGLLWSRVAEAELFCRTSSYLGMTVDTWQRASSPLHQPYHFSNELGLKMRFTDLGAALVMACLPRLEDWITVRRRHCQRFSEVLEDNPQLRVLKRTGGEDSWLMFVIWSHPHFREKWRESLASHGVATSVHYQSLSRHPLWATDACPIAEAAESSVVTLPCHAELSEQQMQRVVLALQTSMETHERPR